jgi:hypothetical protein
MSFTYGLMGWIQGLTGIIVYFIVLNDYGIKPLTLIFLNLKNGYFPKDTDVYDPAAPNSGNTNWGIDS